MLNRSVWDVAPTPGVIAVMTRVYLPGVSFLVRAWAFNARREPVECIDIERLEAPRGAYRARASGSGSAGPLTPSMPLALRSNWTRREHKSIHAIFTSATRLEHNSVAHPDDAEDTVPADRTKVSHVIALLRVSEATRKGRRPGTHSLARAVRGSPTPRIARVRAAGAPLRHSAAKR